MADTEQTVEVRPIREEDRDWVRRLMRDRWKSERMVAHGQVFEPAAMDGFVAEIAGEAVGAITFRIQDKGCEVVSLDALREGLGIGTELIRQVTAAAREAGCRRVWAMTTNDNADAIGFFGRRGFEITAVHEGAVDEARKLKPEIPLVGHDGVEIHDEVELELKLR
ncbi:MAG TPA: GNAT family N-acetyltransferase [Actinomycetota bacterium]|jgi:N-acetylglutamate synthase-like GNAT family acetyltransferase|nr:GNAT family N-acetyltransferase [Actinomycetota bacterium]